MKKLFLILLLTIQPAVSLCHNDFVLVENEIQGLERAVQHMEDAIKNLNNRLFSPALAQEAIFLGRAAVCLGVISIITFTYYKLKQLQKTSEVLNHHINTTNLCDEAN